MNQQRNPSTQVGAADAGIARGGVPEASAEAAKAERSAPLPLRQVGHVGITVADLDRAVGFWNGALGFEILFQVQARGDFAAKATGVPGADIRIAMVSGYGYTIELLQYVGPDDRQTYKPRPCDVGSWHIAFLVDDLDAMLSILEAHGFYALNEPVMIEGGPRAGGRVTYTHDPDGTTIELIELPRQS